MIIVIIIIIIIIAILHFESFSRKCYLIVSHWSLSDSKSAQDSWTLLCIQAEFNNALVYMVSSYSLISESSSRFSNPFGIVQSSPITIGITVTFILHSFYQDIYLSFRFLIILLSWSAKTAKSNYSTGSLFSLIITRFGRLAEISLVWFGLLGFMAYQPL